MILLLKKYYPYTVRNNLYTVHEFHDTIHMFKNYIITAFSVFSFSKNKFNPNGHITSINVNIVIYFELV